MTPQTRQLFKQFRDHQRKVWASGGGTLTTYPSGRTEHSYASAPYGEHALAAYWAARSHAYFLADMKRTVRSGRGHLVKP